MPITNKRWIGWSIAGTIGGIVSSIYGFIVWTNIFTKHYFTGGPEAFYLTCAIVWLVGPLFGVLGGVAGGYSWEILARRIRARLDQFSNIITLIAGFVPGGMFVMYLFFNN